MNHRRIAFLAIVALVFTTLSGCGSDSKDPEQAKTGSAKDSKSVTSADTAQAESLDLSPEAVRELRYSPKVNDVSQHRFTQTTSFQQNGASSYEKITQYYTKVVKEVKQDKSIEMSMRIDSIYVEKKMANPQAPTQTVASTYNSNNPSDRKNDEFRQFNSVVGQEVRIIVSPLGKVEEVGGFTPIFNKMLGPKKDSVNPQLREYLMDQMKLQIYEAPLQQEIQTFPADGKIDSNSSWNRTDVIPMYGLFTVRNTVQYRIAGLKKIKGRTVAQIKATLTSKIAQTPDAQKNTSVKLNKSQMGGSGEALIDLETGVTIFKRNEVSTQLQLTNSDTSRGMPGSMSQSTKSSVTIERVR